MISREQIKILTEFFDQQVEYIRRSSIGTPKKLHIDLSVAHTDLEMNIAGNFFYVINSASIDHFFEVKFNEQREPGHTLYQYMGFKTPYYRFYISNTVQAGGAVDIVYGTLASEFLDVIDNRSQIQGDITAVRDQLQGSTTAQGFGLVDIPANPTLIVPANVDRKSLIIQALYSNTDDVLIGYDNSLVIGKYIARLKPGDVYMVDDYRGDIYGHAIVLGSDVSYGEV